VNIETVKCVLPLLQAVIEGRTIQARYPEHPEWHDVPVAATQSLLTLDHAVLSTLWRVKPASKLRVWKTQEVPIGAVLRNKEEPNLWRGMIGTVKDHVIWTAGGERISFGELLARYEWQWPAQIKACWQPCGILEAES